MGGSPRAELGSLSSLCSSRPTHTLRLQGGLLPGLDSPVQALPLDPPAHLLGWELTSPSWLSSIQRPRLECRPSQCSASVDLCQEMLSAGEHCTLQGACPPPAWAFQLWQPLATRQLLLIFCPSLSLTCTRIHSHAHTDHMHTHAHTDHTHSCTRTLSHTHAHIAHTLAHRPHAHVAHTLTCTPPHTYSCTFTHCIHTCAHTHAHVSHTQTTYTHMNMHHIPAHSHTA